MPRGNVMPEILVCDSLAKSFSGVPVLRGVSMTAFTGQILGVVGENGAGKSTLMNLVGGVHQPDAGSMKLAGSAYAPMSPKDASRKGVAFVHQELNLFGNLSIADNVFISDYPRRFGVIDRQAILSRTAELLTSLNLTASPSTLVDTLPQGERQLVEIAKALHGDSKLIILDEPTTSLSPRETGRLFATLERLRASGIAMVYISHALDDVLRLCDAIVVLRDGELVASGTRAEFTKEGLIALMVGRPIDQLYPERPARHLGPVVLEARELSQPGVVERVGFRLHAGEILGVAGLMGSGRSELARIVLGLDRHSSGDVLLDGKSIKGLSTRERVRRGMAFLTESRRDDGLFMDAPVLDNMSIVGLNPARTSEVCAALGVKCSNMDRQPVRQLSGGNQQKVALGKWLVQPPKVLILDEPTRGIDVGAKHEIYRLMNDLASKGVALLAISSEVEELTGMCDRIVTMSRGELKAEFTPPFDRELILGAGI
jgi:ribose transport system ATP-binding protein